MERQESTHCSHPRRELTRRRTWISILTGGTEDSSYFWGCKAQKYYAFCDSIPTLVPIWPLHKSKQWHSSGLFPSHTWRSSQGNYQLIQVTDQFSRPSPEFLGDLTSSTASPPGTGQRASSETTQLEQRSPNSLKQRGKWPNFQRARRKISK